MDQESFMGLVEEILEVEPGSVTMQDSLAELDWDSLSNISFIAEVDGRIGKSLNAERLSACISVGDLYGLLAEGSSAV